MNMAEKLQLGWGLNANQGEGINGAEN